MNLDFINNLINAYKNISSDEGTEVFDERGHLSRVREIIEWHSLTNQEKHQKRRFIFSLELYQKKATQKYLNMK
jgi:hypothetical protein